VAEGIGGGRRVEYHNGNCEGLVLGDDSFARDTLKRANLRRQPEFTLADVIASVCRNYGIIGQQLRSQGKVRPYTEARALAALLVHESSHLSLTESGKFLDRNIAPLGRAGRLLASSAGTDSLIAERIEELRRELGMAESQS
jgi:chromosomal replication initiation ATPase DnaA